MIWNPDPIAFNVFGISIAWYGLTWSASILLGYFVFIYIFKKENKDLSKLVPFIQYVFIGALIGARLFEMFYYQFDRFIVDPTLFFRFRDGGLSSHGAMLGTISAIYLFIKNNKEFSFFWLLDRSVFVVTLQGAIIRVGNFFNSELLGKVSEQPWAIKFIQYDNLYRHPVQLYESLWLMICFIAFYSMYRKNQKFKGGFFTSIFLMFILGGRVVLEFFKEAEIYFLIFSQTQILSVIAIFIGLTIFYKFKLNTFIKK